MSYRMNGDELAQAKAVMVQKVTAPAPSKEKNKVGGTAGKKIQKNTVKPKHKEKQQIGGKSGAIDVGRTNTPAVKVTRKFGTDAVMRMNAQKIAKRGGLI